MGKLQLSPKGNIILGAKKIGDNCLIHHNVTLGMQLGRADLSDSKPELGERIWIGPDTIIYGNIKVGDGVTILPGSVITKILPAHCIVGGNPGRIIQKNFDNKRLLTSWKHDVTVESITEWRQGDA